MGSSFTPSPSPLVAVASGALSGWGVDAVVDALQQARVRALEVAVGTTGLLPAGDVDGARRLRGRFDGADVLVCGVDATSEISFVDADAPRVLESAQALGAEFVRFFAPPFIPAVPIEQQICTAVHALDELATFGLSLPAPVQVLVEIAPGTLAASPELVRLLVDSVSVQGDKHRRPGVVFDPGSMVAEGHLAPEFAVAILGDRLRHVHVKNRQLEWVDDAWAATSQTISNGRVDWPSTVGALHRAGYRGAYAVDHLSAPTSVEVLRGDVSDLRDVLSAAVHLEPTV